MFASAPTVLIRRADHLLNRSYATRLSLFVFDFEQKLLSAAGRLTEMQP